MKRSQRKKRRKVIVPLASMGDIAFLLIIFFMVLSDFAKDNDRLHVDPPQSEHVEKVEATVVARVTVDSEGAVYLDGMKVENVKDVELAVRALLTDTATQDQRHVQFKCHKELPKEKFEPVLKAIAQAGGIIEAVGEKPN